MAHADDVCGVEARRGMSPREETSASPAATRRPRVCRRGPAVHRRQSRRRPHPAPAVGGGRHDLDFSAGRVGVTKSRHRASPVVGTFGKRDVGETRFPPVPRTTVSGGRPSTSGARWRPKHHGPRWATKARKTPPRPIGSSSHGTRWRMGRRPDYPGSSVTGRSSLPCRSRPGDVVFRRCVSLSPG